MPRKLRPGDLVIAVLLVVAIGLAGWKLLGVYTVHTYQSFLRPAREFLAAGLALDSAALARRGTDPAAARWVLAAGRRNAGFLRDLEAGLFVGGGMRRGDSTVVTFGARKLGPCATWPLVLFFAGPPGSATIQRVSGGCQELGRG